MTEAAKLDQESVDLLSRIASETGMKDTEVFQKVEEKVRHFKGMITERSAITVIARELGISTSKGPAPAAIGFVGIGTVRAGDEVASVRGEVVKAYDQRAFTRNDGTAGNFRSITIKDESGSIKCTFWDERAKEADKFGRGAELEIENARVKEYRGKAELHVDGKAKITVKKAGSPGGKPPGDPVPIGNLEKGKEFKVVGVITGLEETREGEGGRKTYRSGVLEDRTDKVILKFWEGKARESEKCGLEVGDILEAWGRVSEYRGDLNLNLSGWARQDAAPAAPAENQDASTKRAEKFLELLDLYPEGLGIDDLAALAESVPGEVFEPRKGTFRRVF